MQNTILANNGSVGDCRTDDTHGGAVISQGYNLIGNSSGCPFIPTNGDLVDVDPKLGQLIGFPGYIPLATGSPAINAGNPVAPGSSSSACLAVDQRGLIRPVGGRCDMGAYEYAAPGSLARLVIVDGDEQRTGPNMSFAHLLAVAALDSQGSPVSGVSVTFTAPVSDASGTFADSQDQMTMSITNANGVATASLLTANSVVGDYTIAASANGVNTVYFNLQNNAWFVAVGGSDSNSCSVQDFPCATIDGALNKSSRGDIIQIAVGEYTGTVVEGVVIVGKNITLSGGWDAGFTTQSGLSTIDGQGVRGGIYTDADANVIIDRLRIQNTVSAGITNYYSVMILNNRLVTDNNGGGILNNGTLTINRTTISNNTNGDPCCSGGGGGGGIDNSGTLTLNNSLVSANKLLGGFYGSGIYSSPGTLILNNTTVSGNTGGDGAGISTFVGTIILRNSTIASNEGYGLNITAGNVTVQNTIIATNGGRDCYKDTGYGGAINSQGYNLIGTGTQCSFTPMIGDVVGTDANPIDPHIAPLQNYGGPTFTHALISGSPAIDAGNPAFPGSEENACLTTDQRGVARPQGDRCDIGAYELRGPIEIHIGGNEINSYLLGSGESKRVSLPGISSGPVKVADITSNPLFAAERVIYKVKGVNTSFSEMMGLPDGQLDNTYWLPWYNNVDLDTQLRIANVTENPATVQITIGGVVMTPLNLAAGESTRVSYTGVNDGPVQILSDQNIVAAERVIYKVKGVQTSFSEMMALPNRQLDNTYWLPWYNNVGVDTQLRIANASSSPALVIIYIGGESMGPPFTLAVGESMRKSFAGLNTGLVEILSTQNIVVSERMIYKVNGVPTSFSEMMAFTNKQLDTMFWLPWYNNVDLDSQLRLLNLGTSTATVHVYVGGAEVTGSPIMLLPGETKRQSFPGVNGGPVQIVSDQNIVVSTRVIYKVHGVNTSLSEMMALPNSQLDTTYWFPWYNNINLDTQLRFGVP
ncbi:MAG TPA: choice-of-anchor Q domain-containing protein [Anaerolineales bacterium]|nr:choice-of-anchor Q domain-containing protein [Anaerolineales bacterium]